MKLQTGGPEHFSLFFPRTPQLLVGGTFLVGPTPSLWDVRLGECPAGCPLRQELPFTVGDRVPLPVEVPSPGQVLCAEEVAAGAGVQELAGPGQMWGSQPRPLTHASQGPRSVPPLGPSYTSGRAEPLRAPCPRTCPQAWL